FSMNPNDSEARHRIMSRPIRRHVWRIGYGLSRTETNLKAIVRRLTLKHRAIFYLLKSTSALVRLPIEVLRELLFLKSSRRHLRSVDLLIISGGGQLTEKDGSWGFPYTIFKWIVLAKSVGVRCIVLNVGAGPLTRPLSKAFVTRALRAADYVSLRDVKSQRLLQQIGFTGASQVCPDSVYCLDVAMAKASPSERSGQTVVGFAPMPYPDIGTVENRYKSDQTVYDEFIRKLAIFAAWLIGRSYSLTMFGTDIGVDPLAIATLQTALLTHHGIPPSRYGVNGSVKSVHDLLTAMAAMDYVVTCRFHGVVFAHLLNKPVIAIAHHPKVGDLMTDLGLSKYCMDIRNFDPKL